MSIALDTAVVSGYQEDAGETVTQPFTNIAGDFLIVRARSWNCGGSQQNSTGITYNGVSMTKAIEYAHNIGGGCFLTNAIYYLASPAIGTHDVVATWDAITYGGKTMDITSWTGVKQTSPLDDSDQQDIGCASISRTLTLSATGDLVIGSMNPSGTYSPTNGQTEDVTNAGGYKIVAGSGSFSDTWSLDSGCGASDYVDAAFLEATGAATGQPTYSRRKDQKFLRHSPANLGV